MFSLPEFLESLFATGQIKLTGRPERNPADESTILNGLTKAFHLHRLQVAGEPLEFDATTGLAATWVVAEACWFLANHDEPDGDLERCLVMPGSPTSPAQHLSADLLLRYLPLVLRRARAFAPNDKLTTLLTSLLRQWPLSGVLADIAEGPTTPLQFNDHHGLLLLYAERLVRNDRPAWRPTTGLAHETMELVLASLDTTAESAIERRHRGQTQPRGG